MATVSTAWSEEEADPIQHDSRSALAALSDLEGTYDAHDIEMLNHGISLILSSDTPLLLSRNARATQTLTAAQKRAISAKINALLTAMTTVANSLGTVTGQLTKYSKNSKVGAACRNVLVVCSATSNQLNAAASTCQSGVNQVHDATNLFKQLSAALNGLQLALTALSQAIPGTGISGSLCTVVPSLAGMTTSLIHSCTSLNTVCQGLTSQPAVKPIPGAFACANSCTSTSTAIDNCAGYINTNTYNPDVGTVQNVVEQLIGLLAKTPAGSNLSNTITNVIGQLVSAIAGM